MKTFPIKRLKPLDGTLRSFVFENEVVGIARALFHAIEIPLAPFDLAGEMIRTAVRLDFVRLPFSRLRDLEAKSFEFPSNPEDGYVDGSIYLFDAHNPVDVPQLVFGHSDGRRIEVTARVAVAFEYERTGYRNVSLTLRTTLTYEGLRIEKGLLRRPATVRRAKELLAEFVDPSAFGEPIAGGAEYLFPPRSQVRRKAPGR